MRRKVRPQNSCKNCPHGEMVHLAHCQIRGCDCPGFEPAEPLYFLCALCRREIPEGRISSVPGLPEVKFCPLHAGELSDPGQGRFHTGSFLAVTFGDTEVWGQALSFDVPTAEMRVRLYPKKGRPFETPLARSKGVWWCANPALFVSKSKWQANFHKAGRTVKLTPNTVLVRRLKPPEKAALIVHMIALGERPKPLEDLFQNVSPEPLCQETRQNDSGILIRNPPPPAAPVWSNPRAALLLPEPKKKRRKRIPPPQESPKQFVERLSRESKEWETWAESLPQVASFALEPQARFYRILNPKKPWSEANAVPVF